MNVRAASPMLGLLTVIAALAPAPVAAQQLKLVPYVQGLSTPLGMVQDPSDASVQYVLQKGSGNQTGTGRIMVIKSGVVQTQPFLELTVKTSSECGLLGLAFPADYAASRRLYVYHCLPQGNGDTTISRFQRSESDPLSVDVATRKDFVFPTSPDDPGPAGTQPYIHQPAENHKGGKMEFGADGFLYVSVGDGGSTPDAAQDIHSLRGKILRLDVNVPLNDARGYQTPVNPYAGSGGLPELWAIGLRNPWRFGFDAVSRGGTGALVIADVGDSAREEVNYVPATGAGRNFEWPMREGTITHPSGATPGPGPMTPPVFDYERAYGHSISGGYVYRGTRLPIVYRGRYFFADFISKRIGSLGLIINGSGDATSAGFVDHSVELNSQAVDGGLSSVDIDAAGEIYFVGFGGTIYRLEFEGDPNLPEADTDGDGMSDRFEQTFGGASGGNLNPNDDTDGDGRTNFEEYIAGTHPTNVPALTRFFAEGANSPSFFETTIAIANPGSATAVVNLRFLPADGGAVDRHYSTYLEVPPQSRRTVRPADLPLFVNKAFSTVIESDREVAAERTMVWPADVRYGSHTETAVKAPAQTWYLAEGSTLGDFSLYYLIENPNPTATNVKVTYLRPTPLTPIEIDYTVAADARLTIDVKAQGPELASENLSAKVEVVGGSNGIIVERAMYLSGNGQLWRAGHDAVGVTAPATNWFFAEGATGGFFDMYLLLANPSSARANVRLRFLRTGDRPEVVVNIPVEPNSRWTENVENLDPLLVSEPLSTIVESDVPLIAERAIYWPGLDQGGWLEGSVSHGATETGEAWVVADAELGGAYSAETFVLIANTSAFQGRARVTLLTEDGTAISPFAVDLAPNSRTNVPDVSNLVGGKRFSVLVESIPHPNSTSGAAAIVVERASYSNDSNGVVWSAGGTTLATKIR